MLESVQMYAPNAKNMVQKWKWSSFNKFVHFFLVSWHSITPSSLSAGFPPKAENEYICNISESI
jgi:hypothetical protein